MATWQFELQLVPQQKMLALFGELPQIVDLDKFDSIEWWEDYGLPENYENILDSFLPQPVYWGKSTRMWGEDRGDRIEICENNGKVKYILARINVSRLDERFLGGLDRFAKHIECVFIARDSGRAAELSVDFLTTQIYESNAYKYVQSPNAIIVGGDDSKIDIIDGLH